MIATMFFLLVGFFQQCSSNRKLSSQAEQIIKLQNTCDSLKQAFDEASKNKPITKQQIKDEMQLIMYDYLIYENDLDNKKISLSEIKNRIESDDEIK